MQRHLAHSALLIAALGALSACSSDPYHGPVVVGPSVTIINELEPNNSAATAVGIGPVGPFDDLVLTGWVSGFDGFGADGVDGWALQSNSPIRIDFALEEFSAGVHDLDLCLYDPYSDTYVQCFESFGNEYGTIFVYDPFVEFHLVVIAYNASASYDLALNITPLALAATSTDGEGDTALDGAALQSPAFRDADGAALDEALLPRAKASELYLESSFGQELDASLLDTPERQLEEAASQALDSILILETSRE
ncbi:MAG: hypothetical protein ACYS26_14615 [Planctomycetota bacterium]|jgi:hypothetical protein